MLEYIGISDKKLIERCINDMFNYYIELNYGKKAGSIRVKLAKKRTDNRRDSE